MNTKNATVALIAALSYEILLKCSRTLIPPLFDAPLVLAIASILSFLVGLVMMIFLVFFYKDNRSNQGIARMSISLFACLVARFALRIPLMGGLIGFQATRLLGEALGFVMAILLFLLVLWFRRSVPVERKSLRQAASMLIAMLALGLATKAYALVDYARFLNSGRTAEYPPVFYSMMILLFVLTHASAIYFLVRYSQAQSMSQA